MKPTRECEAYELEALLMDDCDLTHQKVIEEHLESCEGCQNRLSSLAADDALWTQTASYLSTVEQIELPPRLTSQLNATSSFVVPTIDHELQPAGPSGSSSAESSSWTQILDPPSHPEMLGKIDQFEVESKIGQGGMGIVLKGFDRELNRAVAIKVLAPYLASNGTARKRFAREAQAAAAVVHPNVVPIYAVNSSPTRPYIVMQLVPGNSLQTLVQDKGPLHPKDVVRVSMQIAAGLAAAHNQGLIHRDVKPGNILIEQDVSRVMITDFGLARAADDAGMTQTGWLAGTPHYMSPEQSRGDDLDPRSDLFSLGSLMYFLATGREPFRGDKPYAVIQKIINQQPTHPIELNADVPNVLADVIDKLLEKDPKNRFHSAHEVTLLLENYLAHLQQPNRARAPKRILTVRRKRRRFWFASSAISIVAVSIVAFLMMTKANKTGPPAKPTETTASATQNSAIPAPNPSGPAPVAPLMFDDQEFSNQLESLSQDIEHLEDSFYGTAPLGSFESSTDPSSPLKAYGEVESDIRNFESTFQSDVQIQDWMNQRDAAPVPALQPTPLPNGGNKKTPNDLPSTQPKMKGKLDEN